MKIIFNNNNNGSDELKELIPFVDADLNFNNIKPDIITATNEVYNLIGKEVYAKAETVYALSDPLTDIQEEFLRVIRYPIAINAYRLYAPTNDLSHTNNGRKMRSDDSQKMPFEWMLDRDNAAQEKRYFRALDDLIQFLDKLPKDAPNAIPETFENQLVTAWITSDAYQNSHRLFVRTVAEFEVSFPIQSRLILIKLAPGLDMCETEEIISRIGKTKFDELKTKLKENTSITEDSDIQLLKLIKRACVFYAMSWAMPRFSVNLYPEGVLQYYASDRASTQAKKPSLNIEPEQARLAFKTDYENALLQIEQFLTPTISPEVAIDTPTSLEHHHHSNKFFTT